MLFTTVVFAVVITLTSSLYKGREIVVGVRVATCDSEALLCRERRAVECLQSTAQTHFPHPQTQPRQSGEVQQAEPSVLDWCVWAAVDCRTGWATLLAPVASHQSWRHHHREMNRRTRVLVLRSQAYTADVKSGSVATAVTPRMYTIKFVSGRNTGGKTTTGSAVNETTVRTPQNGEPSRY